MGSRKGNENHCAWDPARNNLSFHPAPFLSFAPTNYWLLQEFFPIENCCKKKKKSLHSCKTHKSVCFTLEKGKKRIDSCGLQRDSEQLATPTKWIKIHTREGNIIAQKYGFPLQYFYVFLYRHKSHGVESFLWVSFLGFIVFSFCRRSTSISSRGKMFF